MLSHGIECNMTNIFQFSHILQLYNKIWKIIAKYEKQGKFYPILHDKMCDSYFVVILSLYFVMTTLSIGDSTKIRILSERGKILLT